MFTALNLTDRGVNPETFTDAEKRQLLGEKPQANTLTTAMTVFSVIEICDVIGVYPVEHGLYATEQAARHACDEAVGDYLRLNSRARLVDPDCGSDYTVADGSFGVRFYVHELPVMQ